METFFCQVPLQETSSKSKTPSPYQSPKETVDAKGGKKKKKMGRKKKTKKLRFAKEVVREKMKIKNKREGRRER